MEEWNQSFQEHYSVVAIDNDIIAGFGDIDKTGCLDRLYVHADYQGNGIAAAICNKLEQAVNMNKITTHASMMAMKSLSVVRKNVNLHITIQK